MLGHYLEPGGFFKGDYLGLNIDNLVSVPARSTIHRVRQVARAPGPNEYPLRGALREKRACDTADIVEDGILETLEEEEDVEQPTLEEIEDMERPLALEDEIVVEERRIPRAARIYVQRIGPPPRPPVPDGHLDDSTAIKFNIENRKRPASRAYEVYGLNKTATAVGEARRLGASTGHIKYDLGKGYAKLEGLTAVVCVGPSHALSDFGKQDPEAALAAPLLEAWCDQQSALGEADKDYNRDVVCFTERDGLSVPDTVKKAFKVIRQHPGCRLNGSLPCALWSSWQRTNLAKCDEVGRERVRRARERSLEWAAAATFLRLARGTIAKGGSVFFEWPRYCEGWKQLLIQDMIREPGLQSTNSVSRWLCDGAHRREQHAALQATDDCRLECFPRRAVEGLPLRQDPRARQDRRQRDCEDGVLSTLGRCAKPSTEVWMHMNIIDKEKTFPPRQLQQRKQVVKPC